MAQPTTPPPGGNTSPLEKFWTWFGGLPTWARLLAWFFLWPALAAAKLFGATSRTQEVRYGTSAAMLLIGGFVWSAVLTTPFSDPETEAVTAEAAAEETDDVAAEEPEPEPTVEKSESEPEPEPSETTEPEPTESDEDDTDATATVADDEHDVQAEPEGAGWTVFNVVDGDTIDVRAADGSEERVRVIGIDTPERGECGFGPATSKMAALVDGREIVLSGGARDDRDRYDRILRYIDVDSTDAGLELIEAGLAIDRYDSRDGYGAHPREDDYVAADAAAADIACAQDPEPEPEPTKTAEPKPSPTATAEPEPELEPEPEPPTSVCYKNCDAARDAGAAPVRRGDPGYASHLDRDDDGIGCE